jgi:broad specificity phosphatase PhoE
MTEVTFIRHGQTHANAVGCWEGWSDSALTPLGWAQARTVANRLAAKCGKIVTIYTSPLQRALQTATAIGATLGLQPVSVEGLKEINFGELDGISLKEMEACHPALFVRWQDRTDMEFQWPGGERRADFFRRAARACDYILSLHPNDSVVIVTHDGVLRACLAHLLPNQLDQWWGYPLDNCGMTRIDVNGAGTRLLVLNDNTHLPPTGNSQ